MKKILIAMLLAMALTACANIQSQVPKYPAFADNTIILPIDGTWQYEMDPNAKLYVKHGICYYATDVPNENLRNAVFVRNIRQIGNNKYECESVTYNQSRYIYDYGKCEMNSHENYLDVLTLPNSTTGFNKTSLARYVPVALDNEELFRSSLNGDAMPERAPADTTAAPSVTQVRNLQVGQSGDKAIARYDLVGGEGEQEAEVTVAIIIDGEKRPADTLSLSGDFGKGVKVGEGKQVVWDAMADLPPGFEGSVSWEVKAATKSPAKKKAKKKKARPTE